MTDKVIPLDERAASMLRHPAGKKIQVPELDILIYRLTLTRPLRGGEVETDVVTKSSLTGLDPAAWCMGYIRSALARGWTLIEIEVNA